MRRYWLVKPAGHGEHSDERDMTKNQWGARVHWILKSDEARHLHDHPFDSISIILQGGYWEHKIDGSRKWHGPGSIVRRKAEDAHRLELNTELSMAGVEYVPCVSIFITGPWRRDWGFHTGSGWVYWRDYLDEGLLSHAHIKNTPFLTYAAKHGTGALYKVTREAFQDVSYKYLSDMSSYHRQILWNLIEIRMQVEDMTKVANDMKKEGIGK